MKEFTQREWLHHEDAMKFRAAHEDYARLGTVMWCLFASNITCAAAQFLHPLMILGINLGLGVLLILFKSRAFVTLVAASNQLSRWRATYYPPWEEKE